MDETIQEDHQMKQKKCLAIVALLFIMAFLTVSASASGNVTATAYQNTTYDVNPAYSSYTISSSGSPTGYVSVNATYSGSGTVTGVMQEKLNGNIGGTSVSARGTVRQSGTVVLSSNLYYRAKASISGATSTSTGSATAHVG